MKITKPKMKKKVEVYISQQNQTIDAHKDDVFGCFFLFLQFCK